jgi:N-acetylglucosamine kinase-like BadF-type ATPase
VTPRPSPPPSRAELAAVLAVDVGNSKTDVVLVAADGRVLGAVRGPTASHQQVGAQAAFGRLVAIAEAAAAGCGIAAGSRPIADLVVYAGAGVDLPSDERLIARGIDKTGLAARTIVTNDCHAGLRAGTSRTWGVCVIAGSGMNCLGVDPAGREARFLALGEISGDWGGGGAIGLAGLEAAVRAEDGRGPATMLAKTVPAHFGLCRPASVAIAMYRGRIPVARHRELAPVVVATAALGDAVARTIMDRQADEVVAWAAAAIRRLRLQRRAPDVVLAGGVFRADDPAFFARIEAGVRGVAKGARVIRMTAPPVVGAALLGLDTRSGNATPADVERRLRAELTHERLETGG